LHIGDTLRVSAGLDPCPLQPPLVITVRWSSSDTSVASVGTTSGLILARKGGTATIVAMGDQDPTMKGAMLLVVAP